MAMMITEPMLTLASGVVVAGITAWLTALFTSRSELSRHRLQKLHERRAESIELVYQKLSALELEIQQLLDFRISDSERNVRLESFRPAADDFWQCFDSRRIWFDEETCSLVEHLWARVKRINSRIERAGEREIQPRLESAEEAKVEFDRLRGRLESTFRGLLGVH